MATLEMACDRPSQDFSHKQNEPDLPFGYQEWVFKKGKINGEGPFPLEGVEVNLDTTRVPKSAPYQGPGRVITPHKNVQHNIQLQTIELHNTPVVLEPGKNGVPPPDTLRLKIQELDFHLRDPVTAKKPRFKDDYTTNIRCFDKKEGLPNNSILSLVMDSEGIFWLSTNVGVCTFNGNQFQSLDSDALSNTSTFIEEDDKRNIWLAEITGRVFFFEKGKLKTFADSAIYEFPRINCISKDNAGNMWIGTYNGIYKFTGDSTCIYYSTDHGLRDSSVTKIYAAESGAILIGSHSGLSIYEDIRFIHLQMVNDGLNNRVNAINQDIDGNIWFGGDSTLYCLSDSDYSKVRSFEMEGVKVLNDIQIGQDNQIHLATDRGLGVYTNHSLTFHDMESGLHTSSLIHCIAYDKCHNIWTGGASNGLHQIKLNGFRQITDRLGIAGEWVTTILQDSKGNIWYGVGFPPAEALLIMYDGSQYIVLDRDSGFGALETIWDLEEDEDGNILIATYDMSPDGTVPQDGLVIKFNYYDENPGFTYHRILAGGLTDRVVHTLYRDSEETIWAGYKLGFGFYKDSFFTSYRNIERMPAKIPSQWNNTKDIIKDLDGNLWVGSHYCVSIVNNNQIRHLTDIDGLRMNWIMDLHEDSYGRIWVLTSRNGVFVLSPGSLEKDSIEYLHLELSNSLNEKFIGID